MGDGLQLDMNGGFPERRVGDQRSSRVFAGLCWGTT